MTAPEAAPRGSRWGERLSPPRVAAFAVLLAIPAKVLSSRLTDIDLWWHLKAGELIVRDRALPRVDPFSFTAPGEPWVVQEWGSEVLLYGLRRAFGLWGIYAYRAILIAVVYVLVARLLVRRMGSGMATWALLALAAFTGSTTWTERPNLLSFLLFVVVLGLLERKDRRIWWFVPVAALWANLHGMVIIGVGLVGVAAAAEGLKVALRWDGADRSWARRLGIVTAAGFLATFLNPYGPGQLVHAIRLTGIVRDFVSEWASVDFHQPGSWFFLLLLLVTVGVLAMSPTRPDPTDLALGLAFTTLTLYAGRNLTLGGIVLGLVCARYLHGAFGAIPRRRDARPEVSERSGAMIGAAGIVATVLGLGVLVAATMPRSDRPEDILGKEEFPLEAIDALDASGVRVMAFDVWSAMVIERAWPNARLYVDLRWDFYGREISDRYGEAISAQPDWGEHLDRYCTTHVLLRPTHALAQVLALSDDWRVARTDELSVIYARARPAAGCAAHPIPALAA